jgi:SAM-dependent methyltransferase
MGPLAHPLLARIYQATYGRLMAFGYDGLLRDAERAGLADNRRDLLTHARGATLEIGAGTGLNLRYYPAAVTELVLTEPSPHMARRLRGRADHWARSARVVEAPAEDLPFPEASFDTVVATLVLCSVADTSRTLSEIRRVLAPDGRLLFLEHVRSTDPKLAARQDRWHRPWMVFGAGCHCNQDTERTIAEAGFHIERIAHGQMPKMPAIVQPLVKGIAAPSWRKRQYEAGQSILIQQDAHYGKYVGLAGATSTGNASKRRNAHDSEAMPPILVREGRWYSSPSRSG